MILVLSTTHAINIVTFIEAPYRYIIIIITYLDSVQSFNLQILILVALLRWHFVATVTSQAPATNLKTSFPAQVSTAIDRRLFAVAPEEAVLVVSAVPRCADCSAARAMETAGALARSSSVRRQPEASAGLGVGSDVIVGRRFIDASNSSRWPPLTAHRRTADCRVAILVRDRAATPLGDQSFPDITYLTSRCLPTITKPDVPMSLTTATKKLAVTTQPPCDNTSTS
jgi:hypothetical protein